MYHSNYTVTIFDKLNLVGFNCYQMLSILQKLEKNQTWWFMLMSHWCVTWTSIQHWKEKICLHE